MVSSEMLRRVALVRTDVSDERIASIKVTIHIPPKRLFLQEPHNVTSQKTAFFMSKCGQASVPELSAEKCRKYNIRLKFPMLLIMNSTVVRGVMPCSLVEVCWCLEVQLL
jgi:hypothetical protein